MFITAKLNATGLATYDFSLQYCPGQANMDLGGLTLNIVLFQFHVWLEVPGAGSDYCRRRVAGNLKTWQAQVSYLSNWRTGFFRRYWRLHSNRQGTSVYFFWQDILAAFFGIGPLLIPPFC